MKRIVVLYAPNVQPTKQMLCEFVSIQRASGVSYDLRQILMNVMPNEPPIVRRSCDLVILVAPHNHRASYHQTYGNNFFTWDLDCRKALLIIDDEDELIDDDNIMSAKFHSEIYKKDNFMNMDMVMTLPQGKFTSFRLARLQDLINLFDDRIEQLNMFKLNTPSSTEFMRKLKGEKPVATMIDDNTADCNILFDKLVNAIMKNNIDEVNNLIKKGADVNATINDGYENILTTTIYYAIYNGYGLNIIRLLVENGARVNSILKAGWTPLFQATSRKSDNTIVEYLISKGANVNAVTSKEPKNIYTNPLRPFVDPGRSVLMNAVNSGNIKTVKLLINNGANINANDSNGNTPLLWAIDIGYHVAETLGEDSGKFIEIGKLLINEYIKRDILLSPKEANNKLIAEMYAKAKSKRAATAVMALGKRGVIPRSQVDRGVLEQIGKHIASSYSNPEWTHSVSEESMKGGKRRRTRSHKRRTHKRRRTAKRVSKRSTQRTCRSKKSNKQKRMYRG